MIDRIQLSTTDGETLEARWDRSERPVGAVEPAALLVLAVVGLDDSHAGDAFLQA